MSIGENYTIDRLGNVFSKIRRHYIKVTVGTHGYLVFKTWQDGKTKNHQIHKELAIAFIENPENLLCINHKDGNKLNNALENLEWCTHSHNLRHAYDKNLRRNKSISGHKYISFEKQTQMWRVSVSVDDKKVVKGGRYKTVKEALKERDNIINKYGRK